MLLLFVAMYAGSRTMCMGFSFGIHGMNNFVLLTHHFVLISIQFFFSEYNRDACW